MAGEKLEKQNKTESQIQHPILTPAILFANMIWVSVKQEYDGMMYLFNNFQYLFPKSI